MRTGKDFVSPSLPIIVKVGEDIVVSDISVPTSEVDSVGVGCTCTSVFGSLLTLLPNSVAIEVVWLTVGNTISADTDVSVSWLCVIVVVIDDMAD